MMGAYKLDLHGSLPSDSSRGSSNGGSKSSRLGKQRDSCKGGHRHKFFQSKRVQDLQSPPRHSTACCDGLSTRREFERRLSTIVPLQDSHCMDHSFRSEDSDSLALWEENEQPASNDHGWMKLTRSWWLETMRKFDTTKLAPWRSSPVHPKSSLDGQRISLSDRRGSMKSFHESAKSPRYSIATEKIDIGESRSVRSPVGAPNLSRQSGEFLPASGYLLMPPAQSGDINRLICSKHENSWRRRDTQSITGESPRLYSSRDMSSKPELFMKKECLVEGVTSGTPAKGRSPVKTEGASGEETKNAIPLQLKKTTMTMNTGASMDTRTHESYVLSDAISRVQGKEDEESALAPVKGEATVPFNRREKEATADSETLAAEFTCRKTPQLCSRLSMPPSEQDDGTTAYKALRQRYILKSESEPLDGNHYVIQPRTPTAASRVQSAISKGEEADMSSQPWILKSRSSIDADEGHFSRKETSSTPDGLSTSLREKGSRSTRPDSGNLEDFGEAHSPRSNSCGLADEGSLPFSNPSLRFDSEMPAFSALPPTCALQSKSSTGSLFDHSAFEVTRSGYNLNAPKPEESRRASLSFRDFGPSRQSLEDATSELDEAAAAKETPSPKLLGYEDNNKARSSPQRTLTPELWTAILPSNDQESPEQPDSPSAATECESAFSLCRTPPLRRLSYTSPSELEDRQMSSVVQKSRPRHDDVTARLGLFSPRRLISESDEGVFPNRHNCFVASSTHSPPYGDNLGDRSPTDEFTLELLTLEFKGRKSKSKPLISNRRHSSAGSSDAPTMMISINKAMKKILLKCTVKRPKMKGKSKVESPVPDTLRPVDFFTSPREIEDQKNGLSPQLEQLRRPSSW